MQQLFQKTPAANDYGDAGSGYGGGYDDEDDSEYDDEVEGSGFRSGHTPTQYTTLQYLMNAKLRKQRFWHCHENGLIKTIQTIPHKL